MVAETEYNTASLISQFEDDLSDQEVWSTCIRYNFPYMIRSDTTASVESRKQEKASRSFGGHLFVRPYNRSQA